MLRWCDEGDQAKKQIFVNIITSSLHGLVVCTIEVGRAHVPCEDTWLSKRLDHILRKFVHKVTYMYVSVD